jgi:hypothetical protein
MQRRPVTTLPIGVADQNINGPTCFTFGGAHHRRFQGGSSMIYEVPQGRLD